MTRGDHLREINQCGRVLFVDHNIEFIEVTMNETVGS